MKAIRKSDGKIIDVEVHGWQGDKPISYHTNFKDFYKPEDLNFYVVETKDVGTTEKSFDWQSFRAEAAKDILCKTIDFEVISVGGKSRISEEKAVRRAISYVDELIRQLKEKEEK